MRGAVRSERYSFVCRNGVSAAEARQMLNGADAVVQQFKVQALVGDVVVAVLVAAPRASDAQRIKDALGAAAESLVWEVAE